MAFRDPTGAAKIGTQVAQQMFATGVPNVLDETVIASGDVIQNGSTRDYAVAGYASVYVFCSQNGPSIPYYQFREANGVVDEDWLPVSAAANLGCVRLAVQAGTLRIMPTGANINGVTVTIIGTNRPALKRYDASCDTYQMSIASQAASVWSAGVAGLIPWNSSPVAPAIGTPPIGPVFANFVYNSTVLGDYYIQDVANTKMYVSSSAEAATYGSGLLYHSRELVLPPGAQIGFRAKVAGNVGPIATFVQRGGL